MNIIRHLSLRTLLILLLIIIFILLWSVMTWKEYQDSKSDLISSSMTFINQDLASLQLEMEYKAHHLRERVLSRRGINTRYKVLAAIDEKGFIMHATQLAYANQSAVDTLVNFDTHQFSKIQQTHKAYVYLDSEQKWISAYFPLILERRAHEIRPTRKGVIYAIYDLSQGQKKINNRVINSAYQVAVLLLFVMIFLYLFINFFVTKPIRQLVSLSSAIAQGELGVKKKLNSIKELVVLGQSINQMSLSLEARFNERKQAEENLRQHKEHLKELVNERTQELIKANINLKKLSEIDPLTNVFNRRRYETRLAEEVISAKRSGQNLSLMIIDIDQFKEYNDHYGHDAGDTALKRIAQIIKQNSPRQTDLVARFGGEEFIVTMAATDTRGAYVMAEKIRKSIQSHLIKHEYSTVTNVITVSIGISSLQGSFLNGEDLFKQADIALYLAKESGRNRCEIYAK